ncbi:hypothetical protein R6Q57_023498 [Mikania cordata]
MEGRLTGFCLLMAGLGIVSAATGFAAEVTRIKASDVYIEGDSCFYPSSPALALGIISAVFAIVARIYLTVTFGGSSCCRSDPNSTPVSKLLYALSWYILTTISMVASVIAVVLLLAAVGIHNQTGGQFDSYGYVTCYVVKPGIYASGAVLALLSVIFGIMAYVTLISSTKNLKSSN